MFHLGRRPKVPSSFPEGSNIIRVLSGHPRTFCTSANIFHVRLGFPKTFFFERLKSSFSLFLKGLAFLSWIRFHNNNNRFVHEHSLLMTLCLEASKMHPLLSLCSIFKNKHQKYLNQKEMYQSIKNAYQILTYIFFDVRKLEIIIFCSGDKKVDSALSLICQV